MKCIIIGLGKFGIALARRLTDLGHDVIGVDHDLSKVNHYKDHIKNTICLDINNEQAVKMLPLKESNFVFIALGKDVGTSILAVAILKQEEARRIIVRSISSLHRTVLEAMGITEIIDLEQEFADFFTLKTEILNSVYSYRVTQDYVIHEIELPEEFIGRQMEDIDFEKDFSLKLLGIKRPHHVNGKGPENIEFIEEPEKDETVQQHDIFVLFGKQNKFKALQ